MIFNEFFNKFRLIEKLKSEIVGVCDTVVDLGCGRNSPIKAFSSQLIYSLGIDSHPASIADSWQAKIHNAYLAADLFDACRKMADNSFAGALALDVIEHLEKNDGRRLIGEMIRIAKKKVIIYTPNGFLKQDRLPDNPAQEHLSGWSAEEMGRLGFKVYGMSGFKFLRQERGGLKYRPRLIWRPISSLTQIPAYYLPRLAFQILCVKTLNKI
ncbi:hypothetical protein A3H09_03100 [Candidatus Falkowbacteria bacterium RIFCSPLOWO2_12_FULL_45_13]|uniref:Methyltransferase type 11 domain-containing protein n=1 Tax=Candidatus Falkowbacteria bacterium RIFCSPLOWO2_12_FULL_45_13 TaxID=1797991 RepID=A0A1F5SZI4_9BACT|nr:MAG: hypothetical protein A3H09_03100 [Candidatus Falkowbacteria bacterium RIFCSPLOWO2_12_FULL_45_13]